MASFLTYTCMPCLSIFFLVKVKHIVALVSPYSYLEMCAGKVLGGALKPLSTFGLVEHMTIKADRAGWLSPSLILWDFQDGPVGRKVLPILASDGQLYNLRQRLISKMAMAPPAFL